MATAVKRNAAPAPRKTFFRYGTRQRFSPVKTGLAYSSGGRVSVELPRVGFAAAVLARLSGTMTLSAAGALQTRGPWDLVKELALRVNIGASTIYRTTGYGNYVVQRMLTRGFDIQGQGGTPTADADIFSAPVASGANAWNLTYLIPIAENYGKQSHLGLINLQAPEIQVNLDVLFGAPLDAATLATGFTGTLDVGYLYYEVPNPARVAWPPLVFFRTIETDQAITAVGDQVFTAPREGLLHRIAHVVQVNDARTNGVDRVTVRFNKTDEVYRYDRWQLKWLQHYSYGAPLPTGVFVLDWWNAETNPGEGDNRDFVSSEALSTLESIVTTSAAVGGTLNRLDTIRQFTQIIRL